MPLSCGAREDTWKSLGQQGDQTYQSSGKSILNIYWKDWCWSWISSVLVIWCEQLTHWKSPWSWEILRVKGEEGIRGWDGWMPSPMQWIWIWANFGKWWGTGRPGMMQSMRSQRVGFNWVTEQQHGSFIYSFLWNLHSVFHSDFISLHSCQQWKRYIFSSHPLQQLLSVDFLMMAILTCEVIPHCSFDLHCSNNDQFWTSFHVFVGLVLLLLPSVFYSFSFSFTQDIFLFPYDFFFDPMVVLKKCVGNIHVFVNFPIFLHLLSSNFIPLWLEKIFYIIS